MVGIIKNKYKKVVLFRWSAFKTMPLVWLTSLIDGDFVDKEIEMIGNIN